MTTTVALPLPQIRPDRVGGDRLELLIALINAPSFNPAFRADVIRIPPGDPAYPWHCVVAGCERPRTQHHDLCVVHVRQWRAVQPSGVSRAEFIRASAPLKRTESLSRSRAASAGSGPRWGQSWPSVSGTAAAGAITNTGTAPRWTSSSGPPGKVPAPPTDGAGSAPAMISPSPRSGCASRTRAGTGARASPVARRYPPHGSTPPGPRARRCR